MCLVLTDEGPTFTICGDDAGLWPLAMHLFSNFCHEKPRNDASWARGAKRPSAN